MASTVRKTNWFAIWVSVAAVVALVVVTAVVININTAASGPGADPKGKIIDTDAGAVTFGDGDNVIETYVDFLCPICHEFEKAEGPAIKQLVDGGKATLKVHPVAILDEYTSPKGYSSRAASAFYAVAAADPDKAYAFMQAMYENQPGENSAGLTDEQIVQIAKDAGVNVTADLEKAITSNRYQKYVQAHGLAEGMRGTPTLVINGEIAPISQQMDPNTDILPHLK
ncbi:DsbA family protein [Microbacterium luticocti]|uniref:DsbA family protein n=1 Tax=Microbacterium luticocti TaxID=451764 RepID=UPI00040CF97E|nr:thioredoxin domain-containing protein [Microbacterium luticocti]